MKVCANQRWVTFNMDVESDHGLLIFVPIGEIVLSAMGAMLLVDTAETEMKSVRGYHRLAPM